MWPDHKEGRWAVLPVASLWASLDYKSVANLPISVSWILYLTILISEINEIIFSRVVFIGQRYLLPQDDNKKNTKLFIKLGSMQ